VKGAVPEADEVKFNAEPEHTGLLVDAVGEDGAELTVTSVVVLVLPQELLIVTVYVPLATVVAPLIVGFCELEVNPLGPVHEYVNGVLPLADEELRIRSAPEQTGPLFEAVGIDGAEQEFITTKVSVSSAKSPALTEARTVKVYVPAGVAPVVINDNVDDEVVEALVIEPGFGVNEAVTPVGKLPMIEYVMVSAPEEPAPVPRVTNTE
jgi:hypothetical protein